MKYDLFLEIEVKHVFDKNMHYTYDHSVQECKVIYNFLFNIFIFTRLILLTNVADISSISAVIIYK